MCGIFGVVGDLPLSAATWDQSALHLLLQRGPNAQGLVRSGDGLFGHTRLAILDLSEAASQPMVGPRDSLLVYNGEIDNHRDLRRELEGLGSRFRSTSDTEVLLHALERWGEGTLDRLDGMFAFGWYQPDSKRLLLARDHAGIKPLFVSLEPGGPGLAFSSQLDVLATLPWVQRAVDLEALAVYLKLHHTPPPLTLLQHCFQLEPGELLIHQPGSATRRRFWWHFPDQPQAELGFDEGLERIAAAIDESVSRQHDADVPVGVFLSGGVDSTLVAATLRRALGHAFPTFTIGAPSWGQDETADALAAAAKIGLDPEVLALSGTNALELAHLAAELPEATGDFSILPTLAVSRLARRHATVALSGDGGDELFFGYERPFSVLRHAADFRRPRWVRRALYYAGRLGIARHRSSVVTFRSIAHYYREVNSRLDEATSRELAPALKPPKLPSNLYPEITAHSARDLALLSRRYEWRGQLQRCLRKVDLASMHFGLEVRVPLLARRVVEAALAVDPLAATRGDERKPLLRELLRRRVPGLAQSPLKRGFSVPLAEWLRGPLRHRAEETLLDVELQPSGVFDRTAVERYLGQHLRGDHDHKWGLWTLLSLQWWLQRLHRLSA